ncbi:tetratricopeptide repeat protein [Gemmatimonas sp.]|jgi:hypothetical protein|uniref:tetratricopeptide repeat protein n=1 Tax=Gemmatimonas sp. TaxID=1962908 RepID=UPI0037C1986B
MSTAARIDELRKKFEDNPRRYFAPLANELRKAGDLSEAITLCREFLPKQPEHMSGYIVFGQALYESGDLSEARIVFEQALSLDPENLKALRHLGDIAKREGDTAGARRWYERVLEADPRNDDIAAQLATLATPVHVVPVVPVVPEPEPSTPAPAAFFAPPTSVSPISPVSTPPFSMAPIGLGAIPTPDAALRAVDFDEINARLRASDPTPTERVELPVPVAVAPSFRGAELLDLDAIEAAGGEVEPDAYAEAVVEPEAVVPTVDAAVDAAVDGNVVEESADDPFGFSETATSEDHFELPFEEGLIAPEWPDTSELVARIATPRTVTPVFVSSMTPDAVAAFGVESRDPLPAPAPDEEAPVGGLDAPFARVHEPTVQAAAEPDEADLEIAVESEAADATIATVRDDEAIQALSGIDEQEGQDELDDAEPEWIVATAPVQSPTVDHELPWLAPAPVEDGLESATDLADELPEVAALFDDGRTDFADSDGESGPVESSFADVMPEEHTPAFVTETMGELLVSQGFTARAVSVYEELVRRRPYDPVLTSRLAELQERLATDAVPVAPAFPTPPFATPLSATPISSRAYEAAESEEDPIARLTARDRFARLALRRVPRRTPPRMSVAVETPADGLASLFGGDAAMHEDLAARALADAFAPLDEGNQFGGALPFEEAMLGGAARAATPMRSATPIATAAASDASGPFSFDRFFPDPATASSPQHTPAHSPSHTPATEPAREVPPPTVSDDLAQFSAWLKGLGNT